MQLELTHQLIDTTTQKTGRVDKMKRWNKASMHTTALKLFRKIQKRKVAANHNHDIHILARELDDWLPAGIDKLISGTYTPQHLKCYYFQNEVVEQLDIPDRVFQHVLLQQLKPTFKHISNPNCYHLHGPTGVKYATDKIHHALKSGEYHYYIRADIKAFYSSIPHHKLIQDIELAFDDSHVRAMLTNIINNPIDSPWGTKNPYKGITLRGPLSQLFSALYLKPLDDLFDNRDAVYARYQDDYVALFKTKRQMQRAKRRMMAVLHERRLTLSRKKTRSGSLDEPFHFLGIEYSGTRTQDNTTKPDLRAGSKMNRGG